MFQAASATRCGHVCGCGGPGHLAAGEGRGSGGSNQPGACEAPRRPCLYSTRSHSSMHRSLNLTRNILGTMAAWLGGGAQRAPASMALGLDVLAQHEVAARWRRTSCLLHRWPLASMATRLPSRAPCTSVPTAAPRRFDSTRYAPMEHRRRRYAPAVTHPYGNASARL
jgi:hypothetical protein